MDKPMFLRGLIIALSVAATMAFGRPMSQADGEGSATVIPGRAPVREWSTQQVIYTVGSSGIAQGGGIKVQFPKSWHGTELPLNLDPTKGYHILATTCRPGAEIVLSVAPVGIDGRTDRRDWTATLIVEVQSLVSGDVITCTFGDQSGGGQGVQAGEKAAVERVRIASDSDGDGSYVELDDLPQIETVAGPASDLTVIAPSIVARGEPFELAVIAQDKYYDAADSYTGTVTFASTDPTAQLPDVYAFISADGGIKTFTVTLNTLGAQWITVTDPVLKPGGVDSNPIDCRETAPGLKLYWGDMHSHADFTDNAYGLPKAAFQHAREVARLDFYATTDKTYRKGLEYTPLEWERTRHLVNEYYQPGEFVTLLSYEWATPAPYGHHNVYFRGTEEEILRGSEYPTLERLWAALEAKEALTIPHHTGKINYSNRPDGNTAVDWTCQGVRPRSRESHFLLCHPLYLGVCR